MLSELHKTTWSRLAGLRDRLPHVVLRLMDGGVAGSAAGRKLLRTTLRAAERAMPISAASKAFIEEQAAQCGYCMSGMLMVSKVLLDKNPNPSEAEIRQALNGNLCRCGSHLRVVRAVKRAAGMKA